MDKTFLIIGGLTCLFALLILGIAIIMAFRQPREPECQHNWEHKDTIGIYDANIGMNSGLVYVRMCTHCKKIDQQRVMSR